VRGISLAILMVLAIATVLVFSFRSLSREKTRLLQEFAQAQQTIARELGAELEDRLQGLEEDARVIAALVKEAREGTEASRRDKAQTMLASFRAMATVVRHYRSLALFGTDGALRLSAVDPSEDHATAAALMQTSRTAASSPRRASRISGPVEAVAGRHFYLYRFPVDGETVVITIEGPRLLLSAMRSVPDGRVVVTDPGAVEWTGCGVNAHCVRRAASSRADEEQGWKDAAGTSWVSAGAAEKLGLPRKEAAAAWVTTGSPALGNWRVLLVTSAGMIHARETALARRLLFTGIGLIAAIGFVGLLIVRQQRVAAALAERLRSAEALRSLELQLTRAEKLATTGVLAAGIAHEVGTPLGIIRARSEILLDQLGPAEGKSALEAIIKQIDHISSTIRQVLDFSRAQAVEVRSVGALAAVRATLDLLAYRFRQQQIDVHVDVAPDLPPVAADPNQLQQVLINLLINACDACGAGGNIWISAAGPGSDRRLRWEIRDDGAGVPREHLLAVFDPFFTTKKRGEGTGLGLPVAASIVRNHGGEIALASTPGEGTTVTILWPLAAEADLAKG
jgi:signal transduction histidine kinase